MTNSKLTLQFEKSTNWMAQFAQESGVEFIKWLNPNEGPNPFPAQTKVVARFTHRTAGTRRIPIDEGSYWNRGAVGAMDYYRDLASEYQKFPWIHAFECMNEQPDETPRERYMLSHFWVRWIGVMHEIGRKTIIGNFSERHPPLDNESLEQFREVFRLTDYLGMHLYNGWDLKEDAENRILRYRQLISRCKEMGIRVPPIIATEFGVDGGVIKKSGGWAKRLSQEKYLEQLRWVDGELRKDNEIVSACLFIAGATGKWQDLGFDYPRKFSMKLAQYIRGA